MKWYEVTGVDFDKPFIKSIKLANRRICLVGYEGVIFALAAICPHAGADLTGGWCETGKLVCPRHRYSYDLATGKGSEGQHDYVNTYPVKIKGQTVYIGVESFWEKFKAIFK
jgi:nitrite reductase/ring-hydroxylating ferredoxin subunit